jgi:small subunit ribosomal protein S17
MAEENQAETSGGAVENDAPAVAGDNGVTAAAPAGSVASGVKRAHRSQKVGAVVSDKMQKTVVVRVDRLVRHTKYRRYVRRTSKFMAHDELGATIGDKVRIVETRPMSARKRWRVIEIVQKAAK